MNRHRRRALTATAAASLVLGVSPGLVTATPSVDKVKNLSSQSQRERVLLRKVNSAFVSQRWCYAGLLGVPRRCALG